MNECSKPRGIDELRDLHFKHRARVSAHATKTAENLCQDIAIHRDHALFTIKRIESALTDGDDFDVADARHHLEWHCSMQFGRLLDEHRELMHLLGNIGDQSTSIGGGLVTDLLMEHIAENLDEKYKSPPKETKAQRQHRLAAIRSNVAAEIEHSTGNPLTEEKAKAFVEECPLELFAMRPRVDSHPNHHVTVEWRNKAGDDGWVSFGFDFSEGNRVGYSHETPSSSGGGELSDAASLTKMLNVLAAYISTSLAVSG